MSRRTSLLAVAFALGTGAPAACGGTRASGDPPGDAAADASLPPLPPGDGAIAPLVDGGADLDAPAACGDGVPGLALTEVMRGFTSPIYVATAPGERRRLYVVEQGGTVRLVKDGALASAPFVDLTSRLVSGGERGLLGLAFHPGYAENGRIFAHYSGTPDGRTEVVELRRATDDPDRADPASVRVIFSVPQPFTNHNGGQLAFGPDGMLYVGLGDGGSGNDPEGNGQKLSTKLGKILRIDVDAYPTPPAGNLTTAGADPAIWDYGLRNPWRFSFDRATGDLYIGDVGQNAWEEIDWEPPGSGKFNYGWAVMEGAVCRPPTTTCDTNGLRTPVAVHPRTEARSITGGYVYRGAAIPCLRGRYVYGDYVTGRVFSFVMRGGAAEAKAELTSALNPGGALTLSIASFGEDEDGELYLVEYSGRLYRITPR